MKIEFWLDYLNPICYYQHKTLECMIKSGKLNPNDLLYRNYEMIPGYDPDHGFSLREVIESHYSCSLERLKQRYPICLKDMAPVKVTDAHRLSHLAKRYQLSYRYHQLVLDAYYVQKLDISDHRVLAEIGMEIGIKQEDILNVLNTDLYLEQVMNNRDNALTKGIHQIPHIRIDGSIHLSGFVSQDTLLSHLDKAKTLNQKMRHCIGEHCERKKAI